jgi:hypothetical protein
MDTSAVGHQPNGAHFKIVKVCGLRDPKIYSDSLQSKIAIQWPHKIVLILLFYGNKK